MAILKCPECKQVMADTDNMTWTCQQCGTKNGPIKIMMTTCEKCGKNLDYISCMPCRIQVSVSEICEMMFGLK
jgi:hypothetical protein